MRGMAFDRRRARAWIYRGPASLMDDRWLFGFFVALLLKHMWDCRNNAKTLAVIVQALKDKGIEVEK